MVRMSNPHPEAPRVSCLPWFAYGRHPRQSGPGFYPRGTRPRPLGGSRIPCTSEPLPWPEPTSAPKPTHPTHRQLPPAMKLQWASLNSWSPRWKGGRCPWTACSRATNVAFDAKDDLFCKASTAKTNRLIGRDRGVERKFSELSEPPRPPSLNRHLIQGGEGQMCGSFGGGLLTSFLVSIR